MAEFHECAGCGLNFHESELSQTEDVKGWWCETCGDEEDSSTNERGKMIRPLQDRVVVSIITAPDQTAGGIFIPETHKERPWKAKVLAVGPGRSLDGGGRVAMDVTAGDIILFQKFAGSEVAIDGQQMLVLESKHIIGVVEE